MWVANKILVDLFITSSQFSPTSQKILFMTRKYSFSDCTETLFVSQLSLALYPMTYLRITAQFAWLRPPRHLHIPTVLNVKSPQRPQSRRSGERAACSWAECSAASRIIRDKTPPRLDTFLQSWGGLGGTLLRGVSVHIKTLGNTNVFKIRTLKPQCTKARCMPTGQRHLRKDC